MASIGEQLKDARLAQNKSLEEISSDTNISKKYLEALEVDDYEVFPAEVYTRGFLKSYAKNLGLNSQDILDEYKRLKGLDSTHIYNKQVQEKHEEEEKETYSLDNEVIGERRKSRKGLVIALIFIIIAILGVFVYLYSQNIILPMGVK